MNDALPTTGPETTTLDRPPQAQSAAAPAATSPGRPVVMTLEQMARATPIPPSEPVPERLEPSFFVSSLREPEVALTKERLDDPGGTPLWRISIHSSKKAAPGLFVESHDRVEVRAIAGHARANATMAHRPAWVGLEYYPSNTIQRSFRIGGRSSPRTPPASAPAHRRRRR
jgi:hypothetical protein